MSFRVRFTETARTDLLELHAALAEKAPKAADRALSTLGRAFGFLEEFPWSCRASTALRAPRFRELVIPFGKRGCVALFEIEGESTVTILAVRHRRESDFH